MTVLLLCGMVLPTVLIGVISIAFDDATKTIMEETKDKVLVERVIHTANAWLPGNLEFITEGQLKLVKKFNHPGLEAMVMTCLWPTC